MKVIISVLAILVFGCTEKSDNSKKQLAALAVVSQLAKSNAANASTATKCTSTYSCAPAPSFSTLATAGINANCATSGCHTTASQPSGLDVTDYNSVKAYTNSGNPCSSRIYSAITTGSMVGNSNSSIKEAVYCWIAGGSKL